MLHIKKTGLLKWTEAFLTVAFLLFAGILVAKYRGFTYILREQLFTTPMFGIVCVLYLALLLLCALLYRRLIAMPTACAALALFCLALIPRLLARAFIMYYPQSDMARYYQMGVAFSTGNYGLITATVRSYGIPDFASLGVMYGVIGKVFSTAVSGYQLAFSITCSISAALVYLIAGSFHKQAAPVAGFLFAFYPANIVFSQVLSNQHLNVMFALLAIYLLILSLRTETLWRAGLFALLSGISLLLAQYAHPSTAPTILAFSLYLLTVCIGALRKGGRRLVSLATVIACLALGLCGGRVPMDAYLDEKGIWDRDEKLSTCYLSKFVVGLNHETYGYYCYEDYGLISQTPAEEQNALCLSLIRERTSDFPALLHLFNEKINRLWMYKDTAFGWSIFGLETAIEEETKAGMESPVRDAYYQNQAVFQTALNLLDFFYVAALYLFSFFGVLLYRTERSENLLLLWVALGWIGVHMLSEIQTRYRYFAMPIFCIFAAIGLYTLFVACASAFGKLKSRRKNVICQSSDDVQDDQQKRDE